MKKNGIAACFTLFLFNAHAQGVSEDVRSREHSVRGIIDSVAKEEDKEVLNTSKVIDMFKDAKTSAQVQFLYSIYNNPQVKDQYATALGTYLKYELAEFNGFNAALGFNFSKDMDFATGEGFKHNSEISSDDGEYAELSQAYINYKNTQINIRAGRQLIDTPLAHSDDIRIVENTFEAYIFSYELEKISFMGGFLSRWQGTDTGLSSKNHWLDTGKNGTYFSALLYSDEFFDTNVWYYDISKDDDPSLNVANNSFYTDISLHLALSKDYALHANMQYLNQKESHDSGIDASIYGLMAEFVAFEDFALSVAYNVSKKEQAKRSFCGFGGGTLYTSMDSMILDTITNDRSAEAAVVGITYQYHDVGFMYAYGNFKGDADSLGAKEHIIEQNIGFEYTPSEEVTLAAIYVKNRDKESSGSNGGDFENIRVFLSYNF